MLGHTRAFYHRLAAGVVKVAVHFVEWALALQVLSDLISLDPGLAAGFRARDWVLRTACGVPFRDFVRVFQPAVSATVRTLTAILLMQFHAFSRHLRIAAVRATDWDELALASYASESKVPFDLGQRPHPLTRLLLLQGVSNGAGNGSLPSGSHRAVDLQCSYFPLEVRIELDGELRALAPGTLCAFLLDFSNAGLAGVLAAAGNAAGLPHHFLAVGARVLIVDVLHETSGEVSDFDRGCHGLN